MMAETIPVTLRKTLNVLISEWSRVFSVVIHNLLTRLNGPSWLQAKQHEWAHALSAAEPTRRRAALYFC